MAAIWAIMVQVSAKLFDHLITRSTTAYKRGIQNTPTKKVVVTDCRLVLGAGPPMAFIEHCLRHCGHLEAVEATGFGGVSGAFHLNDLLMLLRTMNKMHPAPQVLTTFHRVPLQKCLPCSINYRQHQLGHKCYLVCC